MCCGVCLRVTRLSLTWVKCWREPALAILLIGLLAWLGNHLPVRAQPAAPPLLISEVHAAPDAAGDEVGEWIEIANVST